MWMAPRYQNPGLGDGSRQSPVGTPRKGVPALVAPSYYGSRKANPEGTPRKGVPKASPS